MKLPRRHMIFVFRGATGKWHWRRISGNGRIIAVGGEGYNNRADCIAAMRAANRRPYRLEIG